MPGKPVLTEKPFARNRAEAERVAAAADAAGITVMEGFHYLFHPVTRRALELAGDGTLGQLIHVEARMAMPAPEDDDPRWSLELAGGALMDLGCYGLHVMRRLGHPSVVRAYAGTAQPGRRRACPPANRSRPFSPNFAHTTVETLIPEPLHRWPGRRLQNAVLGVRRLI